MQPFGCILPNDVSDPHNVRVANIRWRMVGMWGGWFGDAVGRIEVGKFRIFGAGELSNNRGLKEVSGTLLPTSYMHTNRPDACYDLSMAKLSHGTRPRKVARPTQSTTAHDSRRGGLLPNGGATQLASRQAFVKPGRSTGKAKKRGFPNPRTY